MANARHFDFVERYFQYQHLPERLKPVSKIFYDAAFELVGNFPHTDEAELMAGLRKLLEAKDCAVRSVL